MNIHLPHIRLNKQIIRTSSRFVIALLLLLAILVSVMNFHTLPVFAQACSVASVEIGNFSPNPVEQYGTISNSGTITGSGSCQIEYYWFVKLFDGSYWDSGKLTTTMTGGSATIPVYDDFPTDIVEDYGMCYVLVTSPDTVQSNKRYYTVEAEPEPIPVINWMSINNGDDTTTSSTVTLHNSCSNDPTHYKASENPTFSGASWYTYSSAPSFTLSSGFGEKTVYFKVKNDAGGSKYMYQDDIEYIDTPPPPCSVASVEIGNFSPNPVEQYGTISNSGTITGSGSCQIEYYWFVKLFDGSYWDSGKLTTTMTGGSATIPVYDDFPTDIVEDYGMCYVLVTSPDTVQSNKRYYTVEAEPEPIPVINWMSINNGDDTTTSSTVTLHNSCSNDPTHYKASENPTFSGASWYTYSSAPSFTLSSGFGEKTVYFKVKNDAGESKYMYQDDIEYIDTPEDDIEVTMMSVSDSTPCPGHTITISYTVRNNGNADTGAFTNSALWSTDSAITLSDTELDYKSMSSINSGGSRSDSMAVTIPSSATVGQTCYIGIYADSTNVIAPEISDSNNNMGHGLILITCDSPNQSPMTSVDRDPVEDLIQPPVLKPYQLQLRVLDQSCSDYDSTQPDPNISSIDSSKPTIVLTHGWNPNYPGLVTADGKVPPSVCTVGSQLLEHGYGNGANIIWWNWLDEARSKSPVEPSKEAWRQGALLADALYVQLGTDYDHEIHFIGHSLGARVNKVAVDDLQSAYDWRNFHVTILDAAEIGDLAREADPIPKRAAWIDNYATAFGDLHDEAVNVILREKMPISFDPELVGTIQGLAASHRFSYEWYACSIAPFGTIDGCKPDPDPELNLMGHQWSFEAGGLNGSPGPGSFYVQTLGTSDSILNLEAITPSEASTIMFGRSALLIGQSGLIVLGAIQKPIEFVGDVVSDTIDVVIEGTVKKVFRAILKEGSPAYMWIPIEIPRDVSHMSFEFVFSEGGDGDYLTVGINELQVFAFEGTLFSGLDFVDASYLDVSAWTGQEVELFIGLNSIGESNAEVIVQDFRFYDLNSQPFVDASEPDTTETEPAKFPWLWVGVGIGLAILLTSGILLRRRLSRSSVRDNADQR